MNRTHIPSRGFSMLFVLPFLMSCFGNSPNETTLTDSDKKYMEELGVLNPGEEIQLFYTQSGVKGIKQSGNLITSERIAAYWIEDNDKEIHSALFASEIDSITTKDLVNNPLYSSYIKVYKKNGEIFSAYIDADSTKTYQFFQQAIDNLEKAR